MARITRGQWPDVVFAGDLTRSALSAAVKRGTAVRLGTGIYTKLVFSEPADVVARHWARILDHELPGAIITDRSARAGSPQNGVLTVVHSRKRPLVLPGLTFLPRAGKGPLPGDTQMGAAWIASPERGLLENLRGGHERYFTRKAIEGWISNLLSTRGVAGLNALRDRARELADQAGWERQFRILDEIIGATLSTRPVEALESDVLRARATGTPFDNRRLEMFEHLASEIMKAPVEPLPVLAQDAKRRVLLPFYEAYFSNYIEGTEFTLDEAAEIVFDGRVPQDRPQDAHDILGTYRIINDPVESARTPTNADELIEIMIKRHTSLMDARPDKHPGRFKQVSNRAGPTVFVAPEAVDETLRRGFDIGQPILDPFGRAVFVSFLISEVHPFDDGNGRVSRMFMNAELSRVGESRIVIPTVYRNNYFSALTAASHNSNFASLLAALRYTQRYTAKVDFSSRESAEADLARTNAFREPNQADAVGIRLTMP